MGALLCREIRSLSKAGSKSVWWLLTYLTYRLGQEFQEIEQYFSVIFIGSRHTWDPGSSIRGT